MSAWTRITVAAAMVVTVGWSCWAAAQPQGETIHREEGPALEAEAAQLHEEAASPNPLVFDPDLAVYSAVVFLILLGVLGKCAWPTISAALDERERKIADNISSAAAKHEEAKRLLAEHEARLAAAAGEVRELLEEARRDADAAKGRIVAEARKAADQERDRAVREIEAAKGSAMQELAVTSAHLAIDLARKVVGQELTANRQAELVRDALGKLATAKPSEN
jgi:F-type H+-transporting ATPase subunit b